MESLTPGSQLTPSLRLVRPLGAGGMGSVWIAEHTGLRTQVVVKFMAEALAANPEATARFSREAAAASLVKSPHVVHMIDYGVLSTGVAFIAMELLEGHDLRHRLEVDRTMSPKQVASMISQVSKALARAHERGVVHRDIKPENIFLSDGGDGEAFVKVLDFGVAKLDDPEQLSHTKTGASVGTPYYMSPEQMIGSKSIDHRTDLWSLGVVAIEAMTGKHPFDGETVGALAMAICSKPLPVPSQLDPSLPASVDAWFARACGREFAERFASAKDLADAFEAAVGGREPIPYVALASPGLGHAPTEMEAKKALEAPTLSVPETAPSPKASSTLGAVSESAPDVRPRPRRTQLAAGAAIGVVAIVGALAINGSRSDSERSNASGASSAAPPSTQAATAPGPSTGSAPPPVVASAQASASTPTAGVSASAPPAVAASTAPTKRSGAGARPPASASSAPSDAFGLGRR